MFSNFVFIFGGNIMFCSFVVMYDAFRTMFSGYTIMYSGLHYVYNVRRCEAQQSSMKIVHKKRTGIILNTILFQITHILMDVLSTILDRI